MIDFRGDVNRLQIDRMVDGELSPLEQQALLGSLDRQSDGWRSLALAYVEAQAMRESLRDWSRNGAATPAAAVARPAVAPVAAARWRWIATAAAAICALIAMALATAQWWNRGGGRDAGGGDAQTSAAAGRDPAPFHAKDGNSGEDGAEQQAVELPVVSSATVDPQQLYSAPPVITPELQAALRRTGHTVYEERRIYPVVLKDGRRVLIPVNDIKVKYVGNTLFQ